MSDSLLARLRAARLTCETRKVDAQRTCDGRKRAGGGEEGGRWRVRSESEERKGRRPKEGFQDEWRRSPGGGGECVCGQAAEQLLEFGFWAVTSTSSHW
jgi:hypothetical protein